MYVCVFTRYRLIFIESVCEADENISSFSSLQNLEALSLRWYSQWPALSWASIWQSLTSTLAFLARASLAWPWSWALSPWELSYHSLCSFKGWLEDIPSVLSNTSSQVGFSLNSLFRLERWFYSQLFVELEMNWWILKPFFPDVSYFCQISHWLDELERCLFKDPSIQRSPSYVCPGTLPSTGVT